MSSSLPVDVQLEMYHSVIGLENCKIMRFAYAIEYDCIDPTALLPSLQTKAVKGLFLAGQINGSSGYEEAAAQGIIAGINCARHLDGKPPVVLPRDSSYIGVLIDDLVTKGTNEPYRMMTARAEHRLHLRQENADERLTPIGREVGLVTDERYERFVAKLRELDDIRAALDEKAQAGDVDAYLKHIGAEGGGGGCRYGELLKRAEADAKSLKEFFPRFANFSLRNLEEAATEVKYAGYLDKQKSFAEKMKKLDEKPLDPSIDYASIGGLRIEARQKLDRIKPLTLGQAARISGVSPADITVLMVWLARNK